MATNRRITVSQFRGLKSKGRKITMLTAYDFPTAQLLDQAGVDGILVGDSLAMVVQGHDSTLPVTLDQIIYHAEIVGRAVERALVVVDMPFPTYRLGINKAIENAARVIKETRGQAVKLECGAEQAETIAALVNAGIPVMAHVGLSPQSVHVSGYRVQRDEARLLNDARSAQDAGAFAVVVECVPPEVASRLTDSLQIPTIGIGAGTDCDGQVLVTHDLLGLTSGYVPSFVREYADIRGVVTDAVTRFRDDVRSGRFPGDDETFK
jgi:3-methyl-2-oxobutanoate hydroxymethyltransferase